MLPKSEFDLYTKREFVNFERSNGQIDFTQ